MLGNNIRKIRKIRKISINELSAETNISLSYLSAIENNKANPTLDKIENIAKVLNVSTDKLINTNTDNIASSCEKLYESHTATKIKQAIDNLNEKELKELLIFIKRLYPHSCK